MPRLIRLVKIAAAALLGLLVVWFEAVRRAPEVRRRKARRRRSRLKNF